MQAKILEKPIISTKKVYVIKDADTMTKEAGNCLLKTLEEPPPFVTIILVATNESALLNTIRSRLMKVVFQKIEDTTLQDFLQKHHMVQEITKERLEAFDGSIEKAQKIETKKEIYDEIQTIFGQVENYQLLDVIHRLEVLYQNKENIEEILDYITILFSKKAKTKPHYIQYIETIEEVKKNLKFNSNYDMSIDNILLNIWEESV